MKPALSTQPTTPQGKLYDHKQFSVRFPADSDPAKTEGNTARLVYRDRSIVITVFSEKSTELLFGVTPNDPAEVLKNALKNPSVMTSVALTTKEGFPAHHTTGKGIIAGGKAVNRAICAHKRICHIQIYHLLGTDQDADADIQLILDSFQPKK